GKRPHRTGEPDAAADVGAAGDHRLNGLAGAGGAEVLQHEVVFLEDAGVLAERGRLVFPVVDLPDCDLQRVLRDGRQCERGTDCERQSTACERCPHRRFPFLLVFAPVLRAPAGLRAGADRPRGGNAPRLSSRVSQYSHARATVLGCCCSIAAMSISPGVSIPMRPTSLAWV